MGISTTHSRYIPRISKKDPRNRHLVPEVNLRTKRYMEVAALEENNAFTVHPIYCAYYKKLNHGRLCTCREDQINKDIQETAEQKPIAIADFLLNVPQLLPTRDNCPICFDVGFVGGYQRMGSISHVLDYTFPAKTSGGVRVEKSRPYIFRPSDKIGKVTWNLRIPKYFDRIEDVAIRWMQEPKEWALIINNNEFNKDEIEVNKNMVVDIELSMRDANNPDAGCYAIFMVFGISEDVLIKANFPNLTKSLTADFNITNEIQSPQPVYFSSELDRCDSTDLFIDTRFHRLWRVLEIETNAPYGKVIDYKTNARVIKDFERAYLVPNKLLAGKYPMIDFYTFVI